MNCLFITDRQRLNQLLSVAIVFIITIFSFNSRAQEINFDSIQIMEPDSVSVNKTWLDKNGNNELSIKVYAACNGITPPFDGHKSMIEVSLKNSKYKLKQKYDEKEYQMCMIFLDPSDTVLKSIDGSEAVFIPFFYCGNADSEIKVSYIILHNKKKYLKHIYFYCNGEGNCSLNDNLGKKLKGMPDYLKEEFKDQLSKYKRIEDFHKDFY